MHYRTQYSTAHNTVQYTIQYSTQYSTVQYIVQRGYVQRPLQRLRADGVVQVLERVAREVVAVVEVGQVVDELRARHPLQRAAAAVQVRVQQHYGARQRVHRVCRSGVGLGNQLHTYSEAAKDMFEIF